MKTHFKVWSRFSAADLVVLAVNTSKIAAGKKDITYTRRAAYKRLFS